MTPYDPGFVAAFKQAIPPEARRWDGSMKRWTLEAKYGPQVCRLVDAYLGVTLAVPAQSGLPAVTETRLIEVQYIGACKDRGNGESSAYGYSEGSWSVIVPEAILREWFEAVPQRPDEAPTLYAVLAVKASATADEVRSAYRRLARQWHPDICHEDGAAETFKTINHAYQVLSNEAIRRKYDAGLALEASLKSQSDPFSFNHHQVQQPQQGYRSPLRCGLVLCEGQETLGRFVVSKLLQWEDCTNALGQTMIASWPAGAKEPQITWR